MMQAEENLVAQATGMRSLVTICVINREFINNNLVIYNRVSDRPQNYGKLLFTFDFK